MTELQGATEPGEANAYAANAGEFAARWNAARPEEREEIYTHWRQNADRGYHCFIGDHDHRIQSLEGEQVAGIYWMRQAEAAREAIDEMRQYLEGNIGYEIANPTILLATLRGVANRFVQEAVDVEGQDGVDK